MLGLDSRKRLHVFTLSSERSAMFVGSHITGEANEMST